MVKSFFSDQMPRWIESPPKVEENWRSSLRGHSGWIEVVIFSPDGQLLASESDDYNIRLWDPGTGFSRGKLVGHSGKVNTILFSPNGQLLVSGSNDFSVRLWDSVTGDSRDTLEGHSQSVERWLFRLTVNCWPLDLLTALSSFEI